MDSETNSAKQHPNWVEELEKIFGRANQAAFGTAVFYEQAGTDDADLGQLAQKWYQYFCGASWEKFGPDNWLSAWQRVDPNSADARSLVEELANLEDPQARQSASTLLDGHEDPAGAKRALSQAYDDPTIEERRIYSLGDGGAMSGIMIAGRRHGGESAFLAFLLD